MEHKTLTAQVRTGTGKGIAGRLRREGKIPAVIYGHSEHLAISVDAKEFQNKFKIITENTIIDIDLEGKEHQVLVKDFQSDIVRGTIDHLDFFEIEKGKSLKARVPVKLEGNPPGVKEGGILVQKIEELEVECLPKDLPEVIAVNIGAMNIGDSVHVGDLEVTKDVKILESEDSTIVVVSMPKSAVVEPEDEEEAEEGEEETEA